MAQRGRKSAASLAVVAQIPGSRRPAPADLTPEQAEVWRQVVASRPANWFDDGSASILAVHCRHVVEMRRLSAEIDRFGPDDLRHKGEFGLYKQMLVLRAQETAAIISTARQLRLTQQSLYRHDTAATKAREVRLTRTAHRHGVRLQSYGGNWVTAI